MKWIHHEYKSREEKIQYRQTEAMQLKDSKLATVRPGELTCYLALTKSRESTWFIIFCNLLDQVKYTNCALDRFQTRKIQDQYLEQWWKIKNYYKAFTFILTLSVEVEYWQFSSKKRDISRVSRKVRTIWRNWPLLAVPFQFLSLLVERQTHCFGAPKAVGQLARTRTVKSAKISITQFIHSSECIWIRIYPEVIRQPTMTSSFIFAWTQQ